jgi:hypothetical protein
MRANPTRRRTYAAKIPNAREPIDAHRSIVKFTTSDRFIRVQLDGTHREVPGRGISGAAQSSPSLIVAENP